MAESGEVDGAGSVEGFLGGADGPAGDQDGVFIAVAGSGVDREAEGVGGTTVAQAEQGICSPSGRTPVIQAKGPRYLAWTFFSCGQFFPAWSSSRSRIELRVEAGIAGMCPIMPPGGVRPGYDHVPAMNYIIVICPGLPYAAACRGAGHADRRRAQDAEETGPGSEDVLAGPAAGADRARRGAGPA